MRLQTNANLRLIPYRAKLCRAKVTNFFNSDEHISPDEKFRPSGFFTEKLALFLMVLIISTVERGTVKMPYLCDS